MSEVIKYLAREYPALTLNLKKENKSQYDLGVIIACKNELNRGYRLLEISEPTEQGTVMSFVYCESREELIESSSIVVNMMKDFEKAYNGWDLSYTLN